MSPCRRSPRQRAHWPKTLPGYGRRPKSNLCLDWEIGDRKAVDAAFARAAHVTRLDLINNRLVVNSMEPRGAIGDYDRNDRKYVLYTSSQGVHGLQSQLAEATSSRFRTIACAW